MSCKPIDWMGVPNDALQTELRVRPSAQIITTVEFWIPE